MSRRRPPRAAALLAGAAALLVAGCRADDVWVTPDLDFNRMMTQPRLDPYEPGAMQPPPDGTRRFEPEPLPREVREGVDANGMVLTAMPVPVTRALLDEGRARYETFCAVCHGVRGTGETAVAHRMALRPPPSLHQPRIRALPPGDVFHVVSAGYGFMPGYSVQLEPMQRWAVVAWLRVLQRSQDVPIARLTPAQREALERTPLLGTEPGTGTGALPP